MGLIIIPRISSEHSKCVGLKFYYKRKFIYSFEVDWCRLNLIKMAVLIHSFHEKTIIWMLVILFTFNNSILVLVYLFTIRISSQRTSMWCPQERNQNKNWIKVNKITYIKCIQFRAKNKVIIIFEMTKKHRPLYESICQITITFIVYQTHFNKSQTSNVIYFSVYSRLWIFLDKPTHLAHSSCLAPN